MFPVFIWTLISLNIHLLMHKLTTEEWFLVFIWTLTSLNIPFSWNLASLNIHLLDSIEWYGTVVTFTTRVLVNEFKAHCMLPL